MRKNAKVDIKDPEIAEVLNKKDPKIKSFSLPKKYEPWNKLPDNPIIKKRSNGKSSVYKDELIKALREQIKKLKHQKVNRISMNVKREKLKIIAKQKKVATQKGKKIGHILGTRIANERIDKAVTAGDRIKAVIAFPIIHLYAQQLGIPPNCYCILVLLNVFGEMRLDQLSKFGYSSRKNSADLLEKLINEDMAVAFGGGNRMNWVYKSTLEGTKIFNGYKAFYDKRSKDLLNSDEYKRKAHNWK